MERNGLVEPYVNFGANTDDPRDVVICGIRFRLADELTQFPPA